MPEFSGPLHGRDLPPPAADPQGPGPILHTGGKPGSGKHVLLCPDADPAGYLSDRFSPKRLFITGILGATCLALAFGLVTSYRQALAIQSLSGLFGALLFAPGLALLTGWFPPGRRATATGLYMIGGPSGSIVFNLAGPLLVARFGWRFSFIGIAAFGITAGLFMLRFGKDPPAVDAGRKVSILEALHLFRYRIMWVCGGLQYIRLGVMQSITYWLPTFLMTEKDSLCRRPASLPRSRSSLMSPSTLVGGYISDRLKNPVPVIGVSLCALGVTTGLLIAAHHMAFLVVLIFLNAIFLQMYFGPLFSVPVGILGVRKAGVSHGFSNFFANVGGFCVT